MVVLLELTSAWLSSTLVFGLLKEWWLFDEDVRQDQPTISPAQWQRLLCETGSACPIARTRSGRCTRSFSRTDRRLQTHRDCPPGRMRNRRPGCSSSTRELPAVQARASCWPTSFRNAVTVSSR